ncbi:hypothetical protein HG535_0F04780 [Zygotorulaspora mrakii]|uniref:Uncharacterized protein n=1 Tax=Zygotorulaspora mrakii TaxID=42260 RepID=A0A7H9B6L5_ZYGMR|nr:uncharacterized protein HG535_0F04780 [Zygotorulaspora mrakii]QLG73966.1 hypothetical protein HG535_0F04780 [Zygotorulaspora mrakii]
MLGKKDKIKFAPVQEVKSEKDYSIVNDIEQLEWYVKSKSKSAGRSHSFMKAVKKSVETNIETQTVYFTDLASGRCGFIQVLYSSVMGGIYKGFQLNFKIFRSRDVGKDEENIDIWESFKLGDIQEFEGLKFVSPELNFEFIPASHDDEVIATLKIDVNMPQNGSDKPSLKIDLMIDLYQGFTINPNGCNYYLEKGISKEELKQRKFQSKRVLRHLFVPRVKCHGSIEYKSKAGATVILDLIGVPGSYIDAVQGLPPNKAARAWNFLCYQDAKRSLICMEFTTTEEYNATTVTIWCSTNDHKIETVGSSINNVPVKFGATRKDDLNGWSYPTGINFPLDFSEDKLRLVNRYDIMGELPYIVKSLAENVAKIKPFIYQYCQDSNYKDGKGISIVESTFIS